MLNFKTEQRKYTRKFTLMKSTFTSIGQRDGYTRSIETSLTANGIMMNRQRFFSGLTVSNTNDIVDIWRISLITVIGHGNVASQQPNGIFYFFGVPKWSQKFRLNKNKRN
jgi:hypothetical protein